MRSHFEQRSTSASLQLALHLAPLLALADRLPLVSLLLPARQRKLHLRPRSREIDSRRHERETPLRGLADQALDLFSVEEQLSWPLGIVALAGGGTIGRDVEVVEPDLAVSHECVRVLQVRLAVAQRLHF